MVECFCRHLLQLSNLRQVKLIMSTTPIPPINIVHTFPPQQKQRHSYTTTDPQTSRAVRLTLSLHNQKAVVAHNSTLSPTFWISWILTIALSAWRQPTALALLAMPGNMLVLKAPSFTKASISVCVVGRNTKMDCP